MTVSVVSSLQVVFCLAIQKNLERNAVPILSYRNIKYFLIMAFGGFSLLLATNQVVQRFLS